MCATLAVLFCLRLICWPRRAGIRLCRDLPALRAKLLGLDFTGRLWLRRWMSREVAEKPHLERCFLEAATLRPLSEVRPSFRLVMEEFDGVFVLGTIFYSSESTPLSSPFLHKLPAFCLTSLSKSSRGRSNFWRSSELY